MVRYKIKGYEDKNLEVEPTDGLGQLFEIWCKVWKDGKRSPELDGYFIRKTLVPIQDLDN